MVYVSKFVWKMPFEIEHKVLSSYTAKYAFYKVLEFEKLWYAKIMTSEVLLRRAPGTYVA